MFREKRNEILEDLGFLRSNSGYCIKSNDIQFDKIGIVDKMIADGMAEEIGDKIWVKNNTTWSELITCVNHITFLELKI